ncbi:MAG: tetratricopeptide repeat protein [Chloroflexota bacterium]
MEEKRIRTASVDSLELTTVGRPLHTLSETEFTRHVNAAFKHYHSILALARSPLAHSTLIKPVLILDDLSPSGDKRAEALRLVLQWAVDGLQPEASSYLLGDYRSYEDPTWQDPRWWRYNILRHRYLEPLHPDEFVEGGRYTETLMALTGIPSSDIFFDERNRAIREVSQRLRQELHSGNAAASLRQRALAQIYEPLRTRPTASTLLAMASTFTEAFPQSYLYEIASSERLDGVAAGLNYLLNNRFLMTEAKTADLWLSPVLQSYVYARQPLKQRTRRHRIAARAYARDGEFVQASIQWQLAGRWEQAAEILLETAVKLINELQGSELLEQLQRFKANQLPPALWCQVQILLSDLHYQNGSYDAAIQACRQAIQAADTEAIQAKIYRRLGKLYEKTNQRHALAYYQQAVDRFAAGDAELIQLYKDRGWLYILRQDWDAADQDLQAALELLPAEDEPILADIYDALATVQREQKQFAAAIDYASQALALREASGNYWRVADSFGNLGSLYLYMGDFAAAIAAYREALAAYSKLNNKERMSGALLNIGTAFHLNGRLPDAISYYEQGLALCREIELLHTEATALHNLAEAHAEQGQTEAAQRYWQQGYDLSKAAQFEDQVGYFIALQEQFPQLGSAAVVQATPVSKAAAATSISTTVVSSVELSAAEETAIRLARENGRLTPKDLMQSANVSKATATRRLAELVEKGLLVKHGKGRGTYYALPATNSGQFATLLQMNKGVWEVQFGLVALGLMSKGVENGRLSLVARFSSPPNLHTFFAFEALLTETVGVEVDLKPETAVSAMMTPRWLWS